MVVGRKKVYELARDLNIESKELLDKLKEIRIEVNSHMSTLTDEQVDFIKRKLAQPATLETRRGDVIERRVRPTVIRRRKSAEEGGAVEQAPSETLTTEKGAKAEVPQTEAVSAVTESSRAEKPSPRVEKAAKGEAPSPTVPAEETPPQGISEAGVIPEKETAEERTVREAREEEAKKLTKLTKKELAALVEEEGKKKKRPPPARKMKEEIDITAFRKETKLFPLRKKKIIPHFKPKQPEITTPKAAKRILKVEGQIPVQDLARRMGVKSNELLKKLMDMGTMVTLNQSIDIDTAQILATDYGWAIENVAFKEESVIGQTGPETQEDPSLLKPRSPVVTVMGHVDHGKTSLLDAIRKTNVTEKEAGGITQHIGAYAVDIKGKRITFIDTPGHEAFSAMRARGAKTTDIVVLVVAADDGVMPQTKEAVAHAKEAKVPIVVAVNKIDKPDAKIERIKQELAALELVPEEWGGHTLYVYVSAKEKKGINELLEAILLQAEILELKANPNKPPKGIVLETRLDRGRGPIATVLVQEGTLHRGDYVVAGLKSGKIRAMTDDKGKQIQEAPPATPVELTGLSDVPEVGDIFNVIEDEAKAKELVEFRKQQAQKKVEAESAKKSLETFYEEIQKGVRELKIILKTDVQGSCEALKESLERLEVQGVTVQVVYAAPGAITESDVYLATVSSAIIVGFNIRPEPQAKLAAEKEKVDIKLYSIIYELLDDLKKAMVGLLEPTYKETILGRAEVRNVFSISKVGTIAGCSVVDGKMSRGVKARLLRDNKVIYDGKIGSVRRFKEDVKEVQAGYECGIGIENFNDIKVGDVIEAYMMEVIQPTLG